MYFENFKRTGILTTSKRNDATVETILYSGLFLFLGSAAALFVTMRGATIADFRRKLRRRRRPFFLKRRKKTEQEAIENLPLVDRRKLDDHARSLEGTVFFFDLPLVEADRISA